MQNQPECCVVSTHQGLVCADSLPPGHELSRKGYSGSQWLCAIGVCTLGRGRDQLERKGHCRGTACRAERRQTTWVSNDAEEEQEWCLEQQKEGQESWFCKQSARSLSLRMWVWNVEVQICNSALGVRQRRADPSAVVLNQWVRPLWESHSRQPVY